MNKYNFWSFCQDAIAVSSAAATGGLSLIISPTARKFVKDLTGSGDNNTLNSNLEAWKIQNEQWQKLVNDNREEAKRLRKERQENEKKLKNNNDEIARINSIINNPNSTPEEKNNAKKRLILLGDENKKLKKALDDLADKINDLETNPPKPPSRPLGSYLPKLKFMDKVILAGGITLLVYLVIIKDDKKK